LDLNSESEISHLQGQTSMSQSPKFNAKKRRLFTKLVRRAHMYTGLLLLPWVILFGLSGMFFNHGQQFGPMHTVAKWTPDEITRTVGFTTPDARSLAADLIESLNRSAGENRFVLPDDSSPTLEGSYSYQANSDKGRVQVSISSNRGSANILRFPAEKSPSLPPFADAKTAIASFDPHTTGQLAASLLDQAKIDTNGPLEASSRGFAELRLQVETPADGRRWNVVYKLLDGSLSGRAIEEVPGNDFYSVVTRLHKTHHYPDRRGARWLWTAFADATGITMVFWGISGLIMWWQMKPTRVIGVAGLSVAAVLGVVIFTGTIADHQFPPGRSGGNGADRKPPAASPAGKLRQRSQPTKSPTMRTSIEKSLPQRPPEEKAITQTP